jgi:hypothetical protein
MSSLSEYLDTNYGSSYSIMANLIYESYFAENVVTWEDFALYLDERKKRNNFVKGYGISHLRNLLFTENGAKKFTS